MQLKSLQIQGFKSFPDKTTLAFDKGITAVVGPNGSGKSNISDAISWVLGEQSIRSLRGEKMEDVIFLGAPNRKATGFAFVALTFDNRDRYFNVDNDEITIARKLYRSGESEYRINNAAVRLKDINELLMDTGLGRDGYSIIGQGKIDEIVSVKSSQRREIFEEAAGISKYQYRKAEAEKKLDAAYENLIRLKDIMVELENRVGPLKEQAEKAQQFLALSQEKKVTEISLWMDSTEKMRKTLEQQEQAVIAARNKTQDVAAILEEFEYKIEDTYGESQKYKVAIEASRSRMTAVQEEISKLGAEIAVLENDILHHQRTMEEIQANMVQYQQTYKENTGQLKRTREQMEQKNQQMLLLIEEKEATEAVASQAESQWQRVLEEIARLKNKRNAYEKNIALQKLNNASANSLLAEARQRLEEMDQAKQTKQQSLEALKKELSQCGELIENIVKKQDSLKNTEKGYQLKLESKNSQLKEKQQQQEKLKSQAQQLLQKARVLEDMERNMEGFQNSVKQIMAVSRHGRLSGIHGPVSQLITSSPQYAVAVETALGSSMQSIVVENEDSAKAAVNYLKFSKGGRCTFLPLSTIKAQYLQAANIEKNPGFVGIAAQLVQYSGKYKDIVHNLLGRIAVAENIDYAVAMAKKYGYKFRIVTLDGQVINAGGSITGGSTIKNGGILSRRTEIEDLHSQAQEVERQCQKETPILQELQEETGVLQGALAHLQAQMKTVQEDYITYLSEQKHLEINLAELQKSQKNQEEEYLAVARKLEGLRTNSKSFEETICQITAELDLILRQVEEKKEQQGALAEQKQKAAESLNDKRFCIFELQKDIEALKAVESQILLAGTEQKEQLAALNSKLAAAQLAAAQAKEAIVVKRGQQQQKREETEEEAKKLEWSMAAILELEQKLTAMREQEKQYIIQKEQAFGELERLEGKKVNQQLEYDNIIARLWDDYHITRSQAVSIAKHIENPIREKARLQELKNKIRALGSINVAAIEEYREVEQRYRFLKQQIDDVERSRSELIALIKELTAQMQELFQTSFGAICKNFSEIFAELFGGGRADLVLTDPQNILQSGIEIEVQPPGKIIKNLSSLSGGEKTLVAIAVYLAILKVKPSPFCVLDEIEAALDEINVVRYAQYLRRFVNNTQFISITHRRGTMEEADIMYGVTMQEKGISRLLELDITQVESKLGIK